MENSGASCEMAIASNLHRPPFGYLFPLEKAVLSGVQNPENNILFYKFLKKNEAVLQLSLTVFVIPLTALFFVSLFLFVLYLCIIQFWSFLSEYIKFFADVVIFTSNPSSAYFFAIKDKNFLPSPIP